MVDTVRFLRNQLQDMPESTMEVVDPSASKESAMAALDWCVQKGKHDLIQAILSTHFTDSKISELRRECVHVLKQAVVSGKEDVLVSLLKHVDDVHITCDEVITETAYVNINGLLGKAVEHGHVTIVEALLGRGGDVNSWYQGKPLLHLALSLRHDELAKLLVRSGGHVDIVDQRGETPLTTAISRPGEKGDIISWLMQRGADPERRMPSGKQAIHVAAGQCPSSVRLLVETGCDVNAIHDVTGDTPLHVACTRACSESIVLLIRNGARFNIQNNNGETPLLKLLNYATNPHDFSSKTRKKLARTLIALGFRIGDKFLSKPRNRVGRVKPLDVYKGLVREQSFVPRLQHLCRTTIRDHMQGRQFCDNASGLEIPRHLRLYLQFRPSLIDETVSSTT
ncbi:ankyrin repeat, PH and SEC7 domain containing protein secG-like isoform X1 [Haliotis rufescens]|uniref:ankyrin repeat, PH and SEC7 domain containing protein secG-like isoform X1 n=2 Tax=Haliotis rufescens TaxID=6454 RepID=UPI00201EBDC4|nr:ankyrin repeat, PH and SEC7 domain containing protein secG-like isoform X1 [Haliotis rufescens]